MITLPFTLQVGGAAPSDFAALPQMAQESNDGIQLAVTVVDQNGNPVNIRNASALALALLRPDGTTRKLTATLLTSGIDGGLQYTTVAADLPQAGIYQIQARYTIGGQKQTTRWGAFTVAANIDA